ncbi:putative GPI-anchored protein At3g06035 [Bidens hawaiensis]|uniref:putative GPI-anchored protein At3g06035 n=1 Tax=Bidens hawaiensis TaxID=980011 RepID=UPI00404B062B
MSVAYLKKYVILTLLLLSIFCINQTVKCDDDAEDSLLPGINSYRATLKLTALTENDRAKCLADQLADQFKKQPCTNTTGSNTVPGTEPEFANYPDLLTKCHLNVTTTRDGVVLPACVPNLDSTLVLSNYTQSQYSKYLNDTSYTGVGIGSEDDWILVVLTTNTPEGGFSPGSNDVTNSVYKTGPMCYSVLLLVAFLSFVWV